MIGVYLVSHEIYALGDRENSLVWFDFEANSFEHFVYGITNHPQLSLRLSEHKAVITISEVMLDTHLVFDRVVEVNGEDEVACGLRGAKPEADAMLQEVDETAQYLKQDFVLEDMGIGILGKLVVNILVEVSDVELVGILEMWIITENCAHLLHHVVRATPLDACACGSDEPTVQVSVNHTHDGVAADAPLHLDNLESAMLAILIDVTLTIFGHGKRAVGYLTLQVGDDLLTVRQQLLPLTALLANGATKNLVEGIGHVVMVDDFLYDIAFSAHSLPLWGLTSSNP